MSRSFVVARRTLHLDRVDRGGTREDEWSGSDNHDRSFDPGALPPGPTFSGRQLPDVETLGTKDLTRGGGTQGGTETRKEERLESLVSEDIYTPTRTTGTATSPRTRD